MKASHRLLALLIACALLFSFTSLTACNQPPASDGPQAGDDTPPSTQKPSDSNESDKNIIYVPPFQDYPERKTIAFDQIVYTRPDYDDACLRFRSVIEQITENELAYEEQLARIRSLYDTYAAVQTAYAYVTLMDHKNSADAYYNAEMTYVTTNYPRFSQVIEELYVACARSPYARDFERDYFEADISEYEDGGDLSDEVVTLLSREAELEASYSSLADTVVITYKTFTGTYNEILKEIEQRYRPGTQTYLSMTNGLSLAYEEQIRDATSDLYVSLVKVRYEIAHALGDENYLTYAYKANGYEYTPAQMSAFLSAVIDYAIPVFSDTEFYAAYYLNMKTSKNEPIETHNIINATYSILQFKSPELAEIYRYMLQYGLFDISLSRDGRYDGAFTTYFPTYDAPYLFATVDGVLTDYLTLYHEFGHFADMYKNYGSASSLDLSEVYSQGLEYMMLLAMRGVMGNDAFNYLKFTSLYSALNTLIVQGYFAAFELAVYSLPYEQITEENLSELSRTVARKFSFYQADRFELYDCLILHTMLYPTYVQSYCTSTIPAIELYLLEAQTSGAGFDAYLALLSRDGTDERFAQTLERVGLSDPFHASTVKQIANEVYFQFLGKHYYTDIGDDANAA